jgi:hypothetical protein
MVAGCWAVMSGSTREKEGVRHQTRGGPTPRPPPHCDGEGEPRRRCRASGTWRGGGSPSCHASRMVAAKPCVSVREVSGTTSAIVEPRAWCRQAFFASQGFGRTSTLTLIEWTEVRAAKNSVRRSNLLGARRPVRSDRHYRKALTSNPCRSRSSRIVSQMARACRAASLASWSVASGQFPGYRPTVAH